MFRHVRNQLNRFIEKMKKAKMTDIFSNQKKMLNKIQEYPKPTKI